jgi:hypothetical protein
MRCPVCKADNNQGPQCRRCRADLDLLFTLEGQRDRLLREARHSLTAGDWRRAAGCAAEALRLRSGDDTRRLEAVARLLGRDFAGAWRCYTAVKDRPVA